MTRVALIVVLVALHSPAQAQDGVLGGPDICQDSGCGGWLFVGAIAGTAALAADAVLIAEGIDKGLRGHGLYESGASFEIFWGVTHLASAAALFALTREDNLGLLAAAVPSALFGAYFLTHGILSLTSARPPPPPEPEPEEPAAEESTDDEPARDDAAGDVPSGEDTGDDTLGEPSGGDANDEVPPAAEEPPHDDEDTSPAAEPGASLGISAAPLPGGASLLVYGRF